MPHNTTRGQWMTNKILQGFFGAPIESLCEISLADVYFQHQRGKFISLYALVLAGSSFTAPIFAGLIADRFGWAWVLYGSAILCAVVLILLWLFMEETNYTRSPMLANDAQQSSPQTCADSKSPQTTAMSSKLPTNGTCTPGLSVAMDTSNLREFSRRILLPLKFFAFPTVLVAGMAYGSHLIWFNVLNATTSLVLSGDPYKFPVWAVGVAYFSPLCGAILATGYTGVFGDWFVIKAAQRNRGIMEPEHRLQMLLPAYILLPIGLALWGVGKIADFRKLQCGYS